MIIDWEESGVIRLRAKIAATALMVLLPAYPLAYGTFAVELKYVVVAVIGCVLIFIWSRPSEPRRQTALANQSRRIP